MAALKVKRGERHRHEESLKAIVFPVRVQATVPKNKTKTKGWQGMSGWNVSLLLGFMMSYYEAAAMRILSGGFNKTFLAALMVFFMSIATVMGPTPPGTGVMKLAFCFTPDNGQKKHDLIALSVP